MRKEPPVTFPLNELALCAEREILMRERVYPWQVSNGKMKKETAEAEIEKMRQVRDLLQHLHRELINHPEVTLTQCLTRKGKFES